MIKTISPDHTAIYSTLSNQIRRLPHLRQLLTPARAASYCIHNAPLSFFYATAKMDDESLTLLQQLADEQQLIRQYETLLSGDPVNVGEKRAVLHHRTRAKTGRGVYGEEQRRFSDFADKIRSGALRGYTGKPFTSVVQIGIGGSDLGPRALYLALQRYAIAEAKTPCLRADFIANIDPDDGQLVLRDKDPATTLFIVVSKSGSTQETQLNLELVTDFLKKSGLSAADCRRHILAVTGKGSILDDASLFEHIFYIDDAIGGRFSSTSAVGGVLLSLAFGPDYFERLLNGAAAMDAHALETDIRRNMSLLAALIGVTERNILGYPAKAIIPYSEALSRFPAHLQQLDCESNGKRINRDFREITYQTGPVIFGEPGTNSQHSFFQKLHQGTDIIPVQFIGFRTGQLPQDTPVTRDAQKKLLANMTAQMIALAMGEENDNSNKTFPGDRPSTLIYGDRLTPETLGALLAFYENLIMFQGFCWNINSFDQEGVQLGKTLTKDLLSPTPQNPVMTSLFNQLF